MRKYIALTIISICFCIDYQSEIQPIFNNNCGNCHLGNSSGGLNLSSYTNLMNGAGGDPVVIPFDHENSPIYDRITRPESSQGDMPPSGSLSQGEIDIIAAWIDEGALEVEAPLCDDGFIFIDDYNSQKFLGHSPQTQVYLIQNIHQITELFFWRGYT